MKIEREFIPQTTIEKFADQNSLTMRVVERHSGRMQGVARFYATFKNSDIKEGSMLVGAHGNGDSEEEAIADYAERISEKTLIISALGSDRTQIQVPRFTS